MDEAPAGGPHLTGAGTGPPGDAQDTFGIPPDVYARRRVILAVLCLSLVIVVIAVSSLNVAIPTLVTSLGADDTELKWIVDGYALVFAGFLLPAGALGDRFGRRGALQIGLVIFGVGALVSSRVTDADQLIATRAVMGLGAALVMPATLSIITNSFPAHERPRAIATWAGFAGAGAALGPIVSGVLLAHFWWGSVFFVNIPLVLVLLVLSVLVVPTSRDPDGHPLDPVGALLSVAALGLLVGAIIQAPDWGWLDGRTLAMFAGAVVFGFAFVAYEVRTPNPMLDPRLFRLRGFAMGSLAISSAFFCLFGMFFVLTQYLQFVKGYPPLRAGFATLPSAVTLVVVSPRSPRLVERIGIRPVLRLGFTLSAAGFLGMATLGVSSPYWHLALSLVCTASGLGLVMPPATASIVSSLPLAKAGVGSAVNDVTREVGGAIGLAVMGSLVTTFYRSGMTERLAGLPVPPDKAEVVSQSVGKAIGASRALAENPATADAAATLRSAADQAFTHATPAAFGVAAGMALLAALVIPSLMPHDRGEEATGVTEAAWT